MNVQTYLDYPAILANKAQPVHLALQLQAPALVHPAQRPPASFCLVLDCSGSMAGEPLAGAREAAHFAVRHLSKEDHFALVVFHDDARTVIPLQPARDKAVLFRAIDRVIAGGYTNLTAGWILGRDALRTAPAGSRRRLLLLSDGRLNLGIVDPITVGRIVAQGFEKDAIRTSCLGFGANYDEDLLASLARTTHGEFHDASSPEKFPGIIAAELEGLQSLVIQNLRARMQPLDFCDGIQDLGGYPRVTLPDGRVEFSLGDLVAEEERVACFGVNVLPLPAIDGRPAFSIQGEPLLHLELLYDEITPGGFASKTFTQTVRICPTQNPGEVPARGEVIQWVAVQRAGLVMDEVTRLMDTGESDRALRTLNRALKETKALENGPGVEDAIRALSRLREQIIRGEWSSRDRKTAKYWAVSSQRMSSSSPWSLSEAPPNFKKKPSPNGP